MTETRPSETGPACLECPVCRSVHSGSFDRFPVHDLRFEYLRQAGIDVASEFPRGLEAVDLRQCGECGLQFFAPLCPGSASFYSQLAGLDTYYCRQRWEFDRTLELLREKDRLVDVGCGDGQFLSLVRLRDKRGLEFNPAAVTRARERGFNVLQGDLNQIAPGSVDVITLFQVLEHVPQPMAVLDQAVRILPPGGRIVIAVPNNDGFIGDVLQNPLNAPPHHVLRWRESALRYLPRLLPIRLELLEVEPLSTEHIFLYRKTCITRWVSQTLNWRVPRMHRTPATILLRKIANLITLASLKLNRRLPSRPIAGQSLVAVYART